MMKCRARTTAVLVLIGATVFMGTHARSEALEATMESQLFELPQTLGAGEDKEVSVLLDASHLKLAVLTLRRGTTLPMHAAAVPATVQVLEGEGVIHVGDEAIKVTQGSLISLAAGAEHDVVPTPGSDMRLLVHYLRAASSTVDPPHADHDH